MRGVHTFRYGLIPLDGPWEGNLSAINQAKRSLPPSAPGGPQEERGPAPAARQLLFP